MADLKSHRQLQRRQFLKRASFALATLAGLPAPGQLTISPSNAIKIMDNANARKLPATGLVQSPLYQNHDTGTGHPERPERTAAVQRAFAEAGLDKQLHAIEPRPAADEEILLCHTPAYLATVKRDVASGRHDLSTGDTTICARSLEIAQLATGGVLNAVDAVIAGKVRNAFCVVRPPGHHANASRGMGFCLFNSIAIAARYAQHKHKLGKVLIADWDVHHGNGTQDIFYEDGSVMVFNTHQSPWYPGTGAKDETGTGRGLGCIVNCPFPSGAGAKEIVGAFKDKLLPAAQAFKPELVLISAGFDSRRGDPLGQFQLTDDDFAELTAVMLDIAKEHAGGRLVSVLEGGYSLIGLAKATTAHVKRLTEAA